MANRDNSTMRIIDANLNRAAEGLRVIEEIARLYLNNGIISAQLKTFRHELVQTSSELQVRLIQSRDAIADVGRDSRVSGEVAEKDLNQLLIANSRRVQESLRVLEELAKIPEMPAELVSQNYSQFRFNLYTIEQQLLSDLLRQEKLQRLKGLYVIIDGQWLKGRCHLDVLQEVIRGGARVVQLREKTMLKRDLVPLARQFRQICTDEQVLFIINDHLDIALDCNADGLHIGQEDLPATVARCLLKTDQLLGITANTVERAITAKDAGADHIGVGAMFPTGSKNAVDVVGVKRLREIRKAVALPIVAIGGINKSNSRAVMKAGATAIAVISAVVSEDDPEKATRELVRIIEEIK